MSNCSSTDCVFDVELFLIVSTQDILWTSNIFYKCYGVSESLIQLLSAKVCKRFFSFFFSSTAHMNTPTHLSITNRFPVSCGTLSPPFPGFLPKITKVTFSKVIFFFFLIKQGKVLEGWNGPCYFLWPNTPECHSGSPFSKSCK